MTDRRPGPPLFELLSQNQPDDPDDGQGSGSEQTEPTPASAPAPATSAAEPTPTPISAGVSRAERSAAMMAEEPVPVEGGVHVGMPRVYMLIALVALALVLVWAMAYNSGVREGKAQMESLIADKPLVLPPLGQLENTEDRGSSVETVNLGESGVGGLGEPPRVPARPAQAVMTAQGYRDMDPREPGYNYLQLATLSAEQAADAVLFMNDHQMAIIGVPVVDSGVRAGNNPSRYTLYSLGLAVPGGSEFRAMQGQRTEHKRVIARLGERWQKERRGGSDFGESKTQWVKYN